MMLAMKQHSQNFSSFREVISEGQDQGLRWILPLPPLLITSQMSENVCPLDCLEYPLPVVASHTS